MRISLLTVVNLRLHVRTSASPMMGHIQLELEALYKLSQELTSGENVELCSSFEIEINGSELTVISFVRNLSEYLLTIEGEGKDMSVILRSTDIPELFIALPAPAVLHIGSAPELVGDLC